MRYLFKIKMSVLPMGLQLTLPAWVQKQVRKIRKPEGHGHRAGGGWIYFET